MLPLICIDVDGTLVGSSHVPTDAVWKAAAAATARGQHLAISTGRGAFGLAFDYARRLDADSWHIFHNGAGLVHTGTGEVQPSPLSAAVVDAGAEVANRNGWVIEFYTARDYSVDSASALAVDHAALLGMPHVVRSRDSLDGDIVRMQLVVPIEVLPWVKAEMAGLDLDLAPATSPGMPGVAFVSCMIPGVSKGTAIERIAAEMAISMADVMMVGDGDNDVDALNAVGHGVVMANGSADAMAASNYQVGHVDDDGLVEALTLSTTL